MESKRKKSTNKRTKKETPPNPQARQTQRLGSCEWDSLIEGKPRKNTNIKCWRVKGEIIFFSKITKKNSNQPKLTY